MVTCLLSISLMFSYCSQTFSLLFHLILKTLLYLLKVSKQFKQDVFKLLSFSIFYWAVPVFNKDPRNLGWKADGIEIFLEFLFTSVENFDAVPLVQAYLSEIVHHLFISPITSPLSCDVIIVSQIVGDKRPISLLVC